MFSSFEDPFCSVASSATLPGTPSTPLPPKLTIFYPRSGQFGGVKWSILDPPDTQKIPPKPEKWTSGGQISLLRMSKLHRQIHLSDTARTPKSGVKTARGGWPPPPTTAPIAPPPLPEKPSNLGGHPGGVKKGGRGGPGEEATEQNK